MLEIILAGDWLMVPILICSTFSVAIIIERFWALRRSRVVPEGVSEMVEDWAARHELDLLRLVAAGGRQQHPRRAGEEPPGRDPRAGVTLLRALWALRMAGQPSVARAASEGGPSPSIAVV